MKADGKCYYQAAGATLRYLIETSELVHGSRTRLLRSGNV